MECVIEDVQKAHKGESSSMTSKSAPLSISTEREKQTTGSQDEFALADEDVPRERFYLELFHRALAQEDREAQAQIQQQFDETVHKWVRLHFKREMTRQNQQEEYYVAQTFACFWQHSSRYTETEFSTLTTILQFLHASLNTSIIEAQRASRSSTMSITPNATMLNDSAEIWKTVQNLLTNTRQQRIAYLLFHCGLQPKEIVQAYPEEFSDALEISRLRYKIVANILSNNA